MKHNTKSQEKQFTYKIRFMDKPPEIKDISKIKYKSVTDIHTLWVDRCIFKTGFLIG